MTKAEIRQMNNKLKINIILGGFVVYMWDKIVAVLTGYHTLVGVSKWLWELFWVQV